MPRILSLRGHTLQSNTCIQENTRIYTRISKTNKFRIWFCSVNEALISASPAFVRLWLSFLVEHWQGPQKTLTNETKTKPFCCQQDFRRRSGTMVDGDDDVVVVVKWTRTFLCGNNARLINNVDAGRNHRNPRHRCIILLLFLLPPLLIIRRFTELHCSHKLSSELFQRDGRWGLWFDTGWFVHDAQLFLPGIANDRRNCMSCGGHCLWGGFRWWEAFERPAGLINRLWGIWGESWGFHRGYCRWLRNSWSIREMIGVEFSC